MFKNFDKVFGFTFKNQTNTKSYKSMTIIVSILLIALPIVIMYFASRSSDEEEKGIQDSGVSAVYVVNKDAPDADFNLLNYLGVEYYDDIKYINYDSVDEALRVAKNSPDVLVLEFTREDGSIFSNLIVPEGTVIDKEHAGFFNDFLDENENYVTIIASGIPMQNLAQMGMPTNSDIYSASGYEKGESLSEDKQASENLMADSIKPIFNYIIIFVTIMILYFVILMYGNSISMHVVMEKESKLMDTMLVSVHPEALVFGKMLGVLAGGLLQLACWAVCLVIGLVVGTKVVESTGGSLGLVSFFKNMSDMGLFSAVNVILAIIVVLFGVLLYSSLSCLAGAISNNREEAASNNGIFILVLVISFYLVFFVAMGSGNVQAPTWMLFVPPVAAMILPSMLLLGTVSTFTGALAVLVLVATSVALTIIAGKLYKMMSLYKGNSVKIGKALKMLFSKT